jgi:nitrite reductase/ring-hydroxylating ferredoxin subunit
LNDVLNGIQICQIIGGFFKYLFGRKFLFDHHDINPELYEAKFGRRDFFYRVMLGWERLTFRIADVSIATNESYRRIAIERGKMNPEKVFVVRSSDGVLRAFRNVCRHRGARLLPEGVVVCEPHLGERVVADLGRGHVRHARRRADPRRRFLRRRACRRIRRAKK